jgi:hypothetical protein
MSEVKEFDSLSTSYVNLAALLRYLREQNFVGSVRVVLSQYEAQVQLSGAAPATVLEVNMATRASAQTEGAMERLLVHAREPGGTITVYQAAEEPASDETEPALAHPVFESEAFASQSPESPAFSEADWSEMLEIAGKLIVAIERAVQSSGADFESSFRAARIHLGDDYPFLDPTGNGLVYVNKRVTLGEHTSVSSFVTGLSECLRRVVNKVAIGKESKRFRETVAIELAVAARLRPNGLNEFMPQLDRIAGTRVL